MEAVNWFCKAADQNYIQAQSYLGICYYEGRGVAKHYTKAVKWFRKAADQNDAIAQVNLGVCYHEGQGLPKDDAESVKWFRKAADRGEASAQYYLGVAYENGYGLSKDSAEAVRWFSKAAAQGNEDAQFNLGSMYHDGTGIPQDYTEAAKWIRRAAHQGMANAQNNLGALYMSGQGVTQDYVEAYKWFNLSAVGGEKDLVINRDTARRHMTPSQIAEAQRFAREFIPRKEKTKEFVPPRSDHLVVSEITPRASGTGFFITDDGYLITNEHVVKDAVQVRLVTSAGLINAKVVKVDPANDLALLKASSKQFSLSAEEFLEAPSGVAPKQIEVKFETLRITSSRRVRLGSTVATIGFPNIGLQGFAPKLAKGEIASLTGAGDDARYFQISVPVQPGNSGGALVDEHGNVVGVVSAKLNAAAALATSGALPENVNYAVKSSFLLSFLESVPEVSAKLKEPVTGERKFEDVVQSAQQAAVLVLAY
jgi:TPR repeat protein